MLRILLLEDSLLDAELIQTYLEEGEIQCQLIRVETERDFVATLTQKQLDLILADYSLPAFDGLSALAIALKMRPEIPFILVSATLGEELAIEALKSGATDYVLKQRLERLVLCVKRALREAAERNARQQAELALQKSEQRFRMALQSSSICVSQQDRELRYQWLHNPQSYPASETILGKTDADLLNPQDAAQLMAIKQQVLASGTSTRQEVSLTIEDEVRYYDLLIEPITDGKGGTTGVACTALNITESKQMQNQLRQQAEALAQANQLKDEFLAILSHELRSPLNTILGWAQILQNRKLDPAATQRAIETIERSAKLQTQLIEDLLDVSHILRGKLNLNVGKVNLKTAIENVLGNVRLAAQAKSISIQTEFETHPVFVTGDANRLQQIIWNLLSNAIKFTPVGGEVTIRLEQVDNRAQIQVSDTGQGIKPDFLPFAFDYFRQSDASTTRKHGGLGIGLAIVRHLVELHGGTVWATSAGENQGATFTLQLPIFDRQLFINQSLMSPDSGSTDGDRNSILTGVRVLVVDDDADTRDLLEVVLSQEGAQVKASASAREAIETLQWYSPDAIVSDIGMPEEDGYTLLKRVRTGEEPQARQIPAIALTAYAREEDRHRAISAGFQDYLSKPVNPAQLVELIVSLVK